MPASFDLLTKRRLSSQEEINIYVSSSAGSNTAAGTVGAPVASLEEALGRIPTNLWGRRANVIVGDGTTPHTETIARPLLLPPLTATGQIEDITLGGIDASWDYIRPQVVIKAPPITVENVTGTLSAEATTGLQILTVSGASWSTDEHKGRILINPGAPAECAVIWGNNATQLFTTSPGGFTDGALRIVRRGATFVVGDSSSFEPVGMRLAGSLGAIGLIGLTIQAASGAYPAIELLNHGQTALFMCEVNGGINTRSAAVVSTIDACYLRNGTLGSNGGPLSIRSSFLETMAAGFHSSSGEYYLYACRVKGCGPMGHGGTTTPNGGFSIDACRISNATSNGIEYRGGHMSRIENTQIDDCAADAVYAAGVGGLMMSNVIGSGNTGHGLHVNNGAQVTVSGCTVTGTGGNVELVSTTHAWGAAPQRDDTKYARFGPA
jgi:hypothetical protein